MSTPQELPADISVETWISHIFDHDDLKWHRKEDVSFWDEQANPAIALNHLDRLFSAPEFLVERFTPNQIGTGIEFLSDPWSSDYAFIFLNHAFLS